MVEKKTKSDEEILFPEVKIGNIVIKPWSFGKLFKQAVILENALTKLEQKGLDVEKLLSGNVISYVSVAKMFSIVSDEILSVISITLDKEKKDIENLDMQDGIKIAYTIFNQNKEIIKNALTSLTT